VSLDRYSSVAHSSSICCPVATLPLFLRRWLIASWSRCCRADVVLTSRRCRADVVLRLPTYCHLVVLPSRFASMVCMCACDYLLVECTLYRRFVTSPVVAQICNMSVCQPFVCTRFPASVCAHASIEPRFYGGCRNLGARSNDSVTVGRHALNREASSQYRDVPLPEGHFVESHNDQP
jgi:hypothetical protein